jgi:selenocysteine-specific elongation factor
VRSVQDHDSPVGRAVAGQRTALNLAGIHRDEVRRGDVVCEPDAHLRPTYSLDATVRREPHAALDSRERLQVHHGTRAVAGRIVALEPGALVPGRDELCQLRLESQLYPALGDRLVLRRVAPQDTTGGGEVLGSRPTRHRGDPAALERLRALARGQAPSEPWPPLEPSASASPTSVPDGEPDPLDPTQARLLELLIADGERPRADAMLAGAAGLDPPAALAAWRRLEAMGAAVRTGHNLPFATVLRRSGSASWRCKWDGEISIASARDELGTSRRYAKVVLEHLDATKLTARRGDAHMLCRRQSG